MNDITIETPEPKTEFHKTSCRNKGELIMKEELPTELIVCEILSKVSADSWEKTIKHICKLWSTIPRDPLFIKLQFQHCKLGLYVQDQGYRNSGTRFLEIQDKMKARVKFKRSIPGQVCDSHDGLLLIRRLKNDRRNGDYYAVNPATEQVVKLDFDFQQNVDYFTCMAKIVGTATERKLKVVFLARVASQERFQYFWYVYNIPSGTYRKVPCPDSVQIREPFYPSNTISIGEVTYWADEDNFQTLAVDVNHETCHSLVLPEDTKRDNGGRHSQLVRNGDHLGLVSWTFKAREINMWTLKDLHSNEWIKIGKIVAVGRSSIVDRGPIRSATFLYDQQILIFVVRLILSSRLVAFDLRTGRIRTMKKLYMFSKVGLHINSLVDL